METVETREYPQGAAILVVKIQNDGHVLFSVEGGVSAGLSAVVLRQLAEVADRAKASHAAG